MISFLTSKLGMAVISLTLIILAYNTGLQIGHSRGEAAAVIEQSEANEQARTIIRERIRDALETAGADSSDADIDGVLNGLTGLDRGDAE